MKITNVCFLILFLVSCASDQQSKINIDLVQHPLTADEDTKELPMPRIQFDRVLHDFGEIYQEESLSIDFVFKNIGDAPLLIRSVKGSCGCTVPKWPEKVIAVGDEDVIQVTFNSGKREGKQKKLVTLVTNAIPSTKVLTIQGTVINPFKKQL